MSFSPDLLSAPTDKIFYALTMFPYPSGVGLHAGHASVFTINDVIARYKTMSGYTVLNPFGFDAFGLPTENYALQQGKGAREVTDINKAMFLDQVKALNISFDYERIIDTSMPDYYKWTQWIFTKLMEAGLVYRDEKFVNRCPVDQTVLANDQVVDGCCERCKSEIIQKKHMQWFIKITDYADRLISDLDLIDRPEETKTTQKNWIGRSEGAEIDFTIDLSSGAKGNEVERSLNLTVFTTRPDTLYGVTAVVLAPENTLIDELLSEDKKSEIQSYRNTALAKTAVQRQQDAGGEKTGVFSGVYVLHPITGEQVPVWFADYVLMDYGSGAVMMVPAHDERDREFAHKFGIEVKEVILIPEDHEGVYTSHGFLINSAQFDGMDSTEAKSAIIAHLESLGCGKKKITYRLRDRSVSRQRYRGSPIPVYYDENNTPQAIPEPELPVVLPLDVTDFKPQGKSPLEDHPTFKYYTPQNYKVPYFEYTDDTWKVQPDKETKLRPTVNAIIQDINTKKYLVLERKIDGTNSFVGGGIEQGETPIQAMLKEIHEEAGFKDIISITTIGGKYHRYFFHALKGINHYTTTQCFFIQVDSTKQLPIDNKELTKHSIQRMTTEELLNNSKLDYDNIYYLNLHLGNKVEASTYTDYYNKYNPLPTYLRECDTLDTFMCSSFYFLRFPDAHNDEALIRKELADKCLPVDFYSGGKEHSVGHLLYSRFIHKFLYDHGYVSSPEPFKKLVHQGMVLGADGRKMGKRYNNGVDPLEIVEKYGSDAVRTYLMFMGPIEADKVRNDNALHGMKKFLDRVEKLPSMERYTTHNDDVIATIHNTIIKVTEDIESYKFNTAVSKLMIAINTIYDHKAIDATHLALIAQLLTPFAPLLAQQIWEQTGHDGDIAFSSRPIADMSKITMKPINFPIQINGKMRGTLTVPAGISEQELLTLVHADESISKYLTGTNKKIIFVADKIMNIINN